MNYKNDNQQIIHHYSFISTQLNGFNVCWLVGWLVEIYDIVTLT